MRTGWSCWRPHFGFYEQDSFCSISWDGWNPCGSYLRRAASHHLRSRSHKAPVSARKHACDEESQPSPPYQGGFSDHTHKGQGLEGEQQRPSKGHGIQARFFGNRQASDTM
eukprot:1317194-Amphidinium_carterae.1